MPKFFLYLDESKNYRNQELFIGGFLSDKSIYFLEHALEKIIPRKIEYELKSTNLKDRKFFESLDVEGILFGALFTHSYIAKDDTQYLDCLVKSVTTLITTSNAHITELHIYADFNRVAPDMRRLEMIFSKKLSKTFRIPICLEFKNSRNFRSIQFADLIVGTARRKLKKS